MTARGTVAHPKKVNLTESFNWGGGTITFTGNADGPVNRFEGNTSSTWEPHWIFERR